MGQASFQGRCGRLFKQRARGTSADTCSMAGGWWTQVFRLHSRVNFSLSCLQGMRAHQKALTIGPTNLEVTLCNKNHTVQSTGRFCLSDTKAWQRPQKSSFKAQLERQQGELLPRFVAHYGKLKTLPRRMRCSLQRHWKRSLAGVAMLMALS